MTGKGLSREEVERIIERSGGAEGISRALKRYGENLRWISDHHEELQGICPNRFAIVHNCRLVGKAKSDRNLASLERAFRRLEMKGIPRGETAVKYIYKKGEEPVLILRQIAQAA